jgi:hypothetical protein
MFGQRQQRRTIKMLFDARLKGGQVKILVTNESDFLRHVKITEGKMKTATETFI